MRLNLGCGQNKLDGYLNIDKHGDPDLQMDLEIFPWGIETDNVEEVVANHVLEHLGRDPDVFIGIMKELYRVCKSGAQVRIVVPHPRHDHFLGDPTHVRVITPEVLSLFSRANCERWKRERAANSPLALYHGVNFELIEKSITLEDRYREAYERGEITAIDLDLAIVERNNIVREIRMVLEVRK